MEKQRNRGAALSSLAPMRPLLFITTLSNSLLTLELFKRAMLTTDAYQQSFCSFSYSALSFLSKCSRHYGGEEGLGQSHRAPVEGAWKWLSLPDHTLTYPASLVLIFYPENHSPYPTLAFPPASPLHAACSCLSAWQAGLSHFQHVLIKPVWQIFQASQPLALEPAGSLLQGPGLPSPETLTPPDAAEQTPRGIYRSFGGDIKDHVADFSSP